MKQILSPIQGVVLLVIYGALMVGATLVLRQVQRRKRTETNMPEFLLANRGVGVMRGAMSIVRHGQNPNACAASSEMQE